METRESALEARFADLDTDELARMWFAEERQPWAEAVLRSVPRSRGSAPVRRPAAAVVPHRNREGRRCRGACGVFRGGVHILVFGGVALYGAWRAIAG